MTINELQRQLNQYKAYIKIQFHSFNHLYTNLKDFGMYSIYIYLDGYTDFYGSNLFGNISSITNQYNITQYSCNNKRQLCKIIANFVDTKIKDRKYKEYEQENKNATSSDKGKQLLIKSLQFKIKLDNNKDFRKDLEDFGKDKWNILNTSKNNFDDFEDFDNNHVSKHSKTITLKLSSTELDLLKWIRQHYNKNNQDNNDEEFGKTDQQTIHQLLLNASSIDWNKFHKVMELEAQYTLEQNGELEDTLKQINSESSDANKSKGTRKHFTGITETKNIK